MKYARQTQAALDNLDYSLKTLRDLIKRGQNQEAIQYMEQGALKERFDDLQSIVTVSTTNTLGSRGTANNPGNL